jgi:pyruvate kinase
MRKTKIVATIGPASDRPETLEQLLLAGLDVARLNFSHGSHEEHERRIANLRQAMERTGKKAAILLDTKGPEIRTGSLKEESVHLQEGQRFILTTTPVEGDQHKVSVTYGGLPQDVYPGCKILIDDGLIAAEVEEIVEDRIVTRILNGGELRSYKGVNVPGVSVKLPGITEKDAEDIRFGLRQGIDFIAASFVRKANDVLEIRQVIEEEGLSDVKIIAKIENQEGLDHLDEILEVADGIMVARGDLGVEVPAEEVPLIQKMMISKCNSKGKVVITATQMLDSMQRNPRPTRAEVADVANAILDGTDALMLSGETAIGRYPVESLKTMAKIAERTEQAIHYTEWLSERSAGKLKTIADAISQAVSKAALDLNAAAILTPTESGYTARLISKYRPKAPIVAVTPHEQVARKLSLNWGVYPLITPAAKSTDEMLEVTVSEALKSGFIHYGDLVVITAGVPVREPGTTNMLKIHVVGDVIAKGQGIGHQAVTAKVIVAMSGEEANRKMMDGAILVTTATDKDMMAAIERAVAVVTEEGGLTSHAAIVGLSLGKPVIVGVDGATRLFKDGMEITVDAERGHIYTGQANIL